LRIPRREEKTPHAIIAFPVIGVIALFPFETYDFSNRSSNLHPDTSHGGELSEWNV
jgi:hypothetical protein